MKKILFYILLVSGSLAMACSDGGGGSSEGNYIDPGLTAKSLNSSKSYTGIGGDCSGSGCQAIIYNGKINNVRYTGIAVKNSTPYNLKIYWPASSIPEGTNLTLSSCTVKENSNSAPGINITGVNITNNSDGTYTIAFTNGISSGSINISNTTVICAQVY